MINAKFCADGRSEDVFDVKGVNAVCFLSGFAIAVEGRCRVLSDLAAVEETTFLAGTWPRCKERRSSGALIDEVRNVTLLLAQVLALLSGDGLADLPPRSCLANRSAHRPKARVTCWSLGFPSSH